MVKRLGLAVLVAACAQMAVFGSVERLEKLPWLGDGRPPPANEADFYGEDPAPEFRADFVLPPGTGEIVVEIACAGYCRVRLNGKPPKNDAAVMPLWSPYDRTVYVERLEFRPDVRRPHPQRNSISVTLGNGFYNLPPLRFWGTRCFRNGLAHGRPCFKARIKGVSQPLKWTWRRSRVIRNCIYLGEEYDWAREEDACWRPAVEVAGPRGRLVRREAPPTLAGLAIPGRSKWLKQGEVQVVDFGVNATAIPRFMFGGQRKGQRIEIVYGERLNPDGSVNVLTQTAGQIKCGNGGPGAPAVACQRDVYVFGTRDCKGSFHGAEVFSPRLTWHVFRYAEVRNYDRLLEGPSSAEMQILAPALRETAAARKFQPAHPDFGRIHEICRRTFLANAIGGVQSDCPGRERLGYGGDIVSTCEAYMLNWDMREFYLKTLQDFADEAAEDGWLTETAPYVGIADRGFGGRAGPISWAVVVPVLMDALIRHYPDVKSRALAFYPVCARYVRLVDAQCPTGIVPQCIGDHEALERAPDAVTATAHWHEFVRLTATFAEMLGRSDEARAFAAIAAKIGKAFADAYVKEGVVANGTQSAQAIALYLGLVPDGQIAAAEKALVSAIENRGHAPTTGIFATRYMLMYLSEHGRRDVAEKIVRHKGFPGWLYMLDRGATTLWETWKESDDVYSNCHPMFGSVDEWILRFGDRGGW
ncbi:MAG: family 78 glycoside hydrolase catalytic domain [Kiritimatiellia bacterium]